MSRRGFALLTALWLITALGVIVGLFYSTTRVGMWESRNRMLLTRGAWAREACHEILLARYAEDRTVRVVDTVDLGRGTWCRAALADASAKLDLNAMSADTWRAVLGNDTLVDAVLDWRDTDDVPRPLGAERTWYRARGLREPRNGLFASVAELRLVRGFDSARVAALDAILTTHGTQQINLNAAPSAVLATLPGMTPEAIEIIRDAQAVGLAIRRAEDLLTRLSPPARAALLDRYQEFSRVVVFEPVRFVETIEGGVKGTHLVSRGWLTVVPTATRLAVIRREME